MRLYGDTSFFSSESTSSSKQTLELWQSTGLNPNGEVLAKIPTATELPRTQPQWGINRKEGRMSDWEGRCPHPQASWANLSISKYLAYQTRIMAPVGRLALQWGSAGRWRKPASSLFGERLGCTDISPHWFPLFACWLTRAYFMLSVHEWPAPT